MVTRESVAQSSLSVNTRTFRVIGLLWWADVAPYDYARIWFGDSWIVCSVSGVTGTNYRRAGNDVLQWGKSKTPYARSQPPDGLTGVGLSPSDIEPLFSVPAAEPATILQLIATASWPPGQAGGLEGSDLASLLALNRAFGVGILSPPYVASGVTDWWPMPAEGRGSVAEAMAAGICAPLGCALTTDRTGRLTVIDWTRVLGGSDVITGDELRAPATQLQTAAALRSITWKYTEGGVTDTVRVNSDYASQVTGGGTSIERSPGWCVEFAPAALSRLITLLTIWQYPAPIIPLEVATSVEVDTGDIRRVTVPTIVGRDGLRGIVAMDAVVLSVTRTLQRPVDSVTVALTGYTATPTLGLWSPSGIVAGISGTTLTLTMDNLDAAADWFGPGTLCQLVSADGAIIEQLVVDTAVANDITFVTIVATPVLGDRIILAAGDVAEQTGSAYWSRGFDYV